MSQLKISKTRQKKVTTKNRGRDLSSEMGHPIWGNPFETFESGPIAGNVKIGILRKEKEALPKPRFLGD